ncbi:DUF4867 family protein [bacterium]|nr:DUF4867 family protein [bacterium]
MSIVALRNANPSLRIRDITDPALADYGRLLPPAPFAPLVDLADRITDIDPAGNRYVASLSELEADPRTDLLKARFGFAPFQVGYCNGPNSTLNALEWHKSAEIDIAVTDLVLLLGKRNDIGADGRYDSSKLDCFYLAKGTVLELLPEALHFSPCKALATGFKSIIALPAGTNQPLTSDDLAASRQASLALGDIEPSLLFMNNKWLIAHPERKALIERGAFPGITGENIAIKSV